jgi:hypothetical protein
MISPKDSRNLKSKERSAREQIYCRRYNRLYTSCPVEDELHLCECLSQCEMAHRGNGADGLRRTG